MSNYCRFTWCDSVKNKYILYEKIKNSDVICMTRENIASNTQSTPLFISRTANVLLLNLGNESDLVPHSNCRLTLFTFYTVFR